MKKLTRKDLMELAGGLQSVANVPGTKFAYAIAKNMRIVASKSKEFEKELEPTANFLEYDKKRAEIAESFADKDENGNAKSEANRFIVNPENKIKLDAAVEKLKAENKETIDARQKQLDDFDKALDNEVEVDLYLIPQSMLPENLTPRQMDGIMCIIDEKPANASQSVN